MEIFFIKAGKNANELVDILFWKPMHILSNPFEENNFYENFEKDTPLFMEQNIESTKTNFSPIIEDILEDKENIEIIKPNISPIKYEPKLQEIPQLEPRSPKNKLRIDGYKSPVNDKYYNINIAF